ncbi:hypothetical protein JTE90_026468 [Oedothorax gibbosus]|uniref:Uncharacterized protein n=1 Tax=Oedothorax gibbosus TaxID=931172 RepID=A0AAV6VPL1_9ARAC|nr:hypothetical protein JTE90_026468 [Oedothorax gibbosus]
MGWLNLYYGFWKGTMLIAAVLLLNCTVFSLLYSDFTYSPGKASSEFTADAIQSAVVTPKSTRKPVKTLQSEDKVQEATQTDSCDMADQETESRLPVEDSQPIQTANNSLPLEEQPWCNRLAYMVQDIPICVF